MIPVKTTTLIQALCWCIDFVDNISFNIGLSYCALLNQIKSLVSSQTYVNFTKKDKNECIMLVLFCIPLTQCSTRINSLECTGPLILHNLHFTGNSMDEILKVAKFSCGQDKTAPNWLWTRLSTFSSFYQDYSSLHGSWTDLKSSCLPIQLRLFLILKNLQWS